MPETEIDPIEGQDTDEVTNEETVETTETEEVATPAVEARIEKIVAGIKDKLDSAPASKQPSQEEIRAAWRAQVKKTTNMTDEQIDYMEGRLEAVVAPLYAQNTFTEWKMEKGEVLTPEVEKEVKEYLNKYPASQRNDKVLLDNIMFMAIGKHAAKTKTAKKPVVTEEVTEETTEETIVPAATTRRKIVPITPGSTTGLSGGKPVKTGAASLTADEKNIARKMRMTEDEYAAAKTTAVISELRKK